MESIMNYLYEYEKYYRRAAPTTHNSIPIFSLRMERLDWMCLLSCMRPAAKYEKLLVFQWSWRVWWICWNESMKATLLLRSSIGGLWAVAPPMAPPRRANAEREKSWWIDEWNQIQIKQSKSKWMSWWMKQQANQ